MMSRFYETIATEGHERCLNRKLEKKRATTK